MASAWPDRAGDPFAEQMNAIPKYVASRTLEEPLEWRNSTLLKGDAADAVAALKLQQDKDLVILGSGELIRSLMPHGLIDEYRLVLHPVALGEGLPLSKGLTSPLCLGGKTSSARTRATERPAPSSSLTI